jgi:hypothetical protein
MLNFSKYGIILLIFSFTLFGCTTSNIYYENYYVEEEEQIIDEPIYVEMPVYIGPIVVQNPTKQRESQERGKAQEVHKSVKDSYHERNVPHMQEIKKRSEEEQKVKTKPIGKSR